ncbi:MAG: hypothetical protein OXU66_01130 [Gammaproteobacteria bacterium]|nr:hypothetical protein [Gammaproteobacteria bacterium]MDD9895464.1 hypothetical protein [Gammaproteobacteria bacterium]MDD9957519.1 hypothetical protein [Gammaproteobacteria bacterium]
MTTIIAFLAVAMVMAGVILLISPALLMEFIQENASKPSLRASAVAIRVVFGAALLMEAADSRFPYIVGFIGAIALIAAIVIAAVPKASAEEFAMRISSMPAMFMRFGGLACFVFAWFLVYAIL